MVILALNKLFMGGMAGSHDDSEAAAMGHAPGTCLVQPGIGRIKSAKGRAICKNAA